MIIKPLIFTGMILTSLAFSACIVKNDTTINEETTRDPEAIIENTTLTPESPIPDPTLKPTLAPVVPTTEETGTATPQPN